MGSYRDLLPLGVLGKHVEMQGVAHMNATRVDVGGTLGREVRQGQLALEADGAVAAFLGWGIKQLPAEYSA